MEKVISLMKKKNILYILSFGLILSLIFPFTSQAASSITISGVGSSTQVIVITGATKSSKTGTLTMYNKSGNTWTKVMSAQTMIGKNRLCYHR